VSWWVFRRASVRLGGVQCSYLSSFLCGLFLWCRVGWTGSLGLPSVFSSVQPEFGTGCSTVQLHHRCEQAAVITHELSLGGSRRSTLAAMSQPLCTVGSQCVFCCCFHMLLCGTWPCAVSMLAVSMLAAHEGRVDRGAAHMAGNRTSNPCWLS
jgi:hypothetical protein